MHTKLKSFILFVLLFGPLSGAWCQPPPDTAGMEKNLTGHERLEGKWFLVPALDSDTATGKIPEIQFDSKENRFSGNTGCNRMNGSFVITDTSLRFSDKMITTKMFCSGYNETAFIDNLLRVDGYSLKNGMLILTVNGMEVSRWSRKMIKAKKTGKT